MFGGMRAGDDGCVCRIGDRGKDADHPIGTGPFPGHLLEHRCRPVDIAVELGSQTVDRDENNVIAWSLGSTRIGGESGRQKGDSCQGKARVHGPQV